MATGGSTASPGVSPDGVTSTYPENRRLIYEFGGEGNDWCFVYLPENYDENRAEKYPFVIANHGNGWSMDGSEKMANWTNHTSYVPKTDSRYLSNPTQYNGTDNANLWYSNPTIETYNVGEGCYMIGASNGAMTTLNTSYLLGEKVKAIVLQYPLTCLKNQYFGYEGHQAGIRSAYGITQTVTEENFLDLIGGPEFDPLYANVENGVKQGYFPATKIYYSTTDPLTTSELNAIPLYNLLVNSGKTVEKVQVDADGVNRGHGNYAHFDPRGFVNWFNKY